MKVLIVDDEAHVIRAVKLLVPWQDMGITEILEALTPQDAIALIETQQPEIVITDIVMQDLSGIDLMKYITGARRHIKVIVISGYNNFDYVRSSLQQGGVDYLLKPLDQEQMVAAVKKAVDAWNQEHDLYRTSLAWQDQIDSMTTLCRENLLSRMIRRDHPEETYQKLIELSPELSGLTSCGFGYFSARLFLSPEDDTWKEPFSVYRDAVSRFLTKWNAGFLLPGEDAYEITVFLTEFPSSFLEKFEEYLTEIRNSLPFPGCMGIAFGHFPEEITGIYEAARRALGAFDLSARSPVLMKPDPELPRILSGMTDTQKEADNRMLLSALLTGNDSFMYDCIRRWIANRTFGKNPLLAVVSNAISDENRLFDSWVPLFEARHQGFVHKYDYQTLNFPDIMDQSTGLSFELFEKRMHMDLTFLYEELKSIRSPESDMIYQVAHYMELNYNQPFSQAACARMFFVNQEYLCRKFKHTFHVTMITYLNRIRIDHAKEMLKDPLIKIRQIAHEVGFEDEKYFSRQFKKSVGITPNEYRVFSVENREEAKL